MLGPCSHGDMVSVQKFPYHSNNSKATVRMAFSLSYTSAIKPAEQETGECEEMRRLKFISSTSRAYALPSIQRKCARCNDMLLAETVLSVSVLQKKRCMVEKIFFKFSRAKIRAQSFLRLSCFQEEENCQAI